jgi:hypothetical protein
MRWIALACITVLLVGCQDSTESPSATSPSSTSAEGEASAPPVPDVVNGRIVNAEPAKRPPASWCPDCDFSIPHDRAGDVALYLRRAGTQRSGSTWTDGIAVVGPRGVDLQISCPADFPCLEKGSAPRAEDLAQVDWQYAGWGPVVLGPADGEFSMSLFPQRIDVRSYDGRELRSVRLRGLAEDEVVDELAWSPDGRQLAVVTIRWTATARLWIFDADGRHGKVRYTGHEESFAYLEDLAWSPTGESLSVLEGDEYGQPARGVYLVVVGTEAGKARKIYWWSGGPGGGGTHVWSPDGQRIAVEVGRRLLELSVDDGRVLARHQRVRDPVWLPRSP